MAFTEGNIRKFLEDHQFPDEEKTAILEKFRGLQEEYGFPIIPAGLIPMFMDGRTAEFIEEVLTSPEHGEICVSALRNLKKTRMIMRMAEIMKMRMRMLKDESSQGGEK